jgi:hypothetical protein
MYVQAIRDKLRNKTGYELVRRPENLEGNYGPVISDKDFPNLDRHQVEAELEKQSKAIEEKIKAAIEANKINKDIDTGFDIKRR